MPQSVSLPVAIPKFDEHHYLEVNPAAADAIRAGAADSALDHYVRFGIEENRYTAIRREPTHLQGCVERFLVSQSGYCLLIGWMADEGCDQSRFKLFGGEFNIEFPPDVIFRHSRGDVENHIKAGAFDYGFVAFGRSPSRSLLKQPMLFQSLAVAGIFQCRITPELVSDKRMLDTVLEVVATCQAHASKEGALYPFLTGAAGRAAIELFQAHVATCTANPYIQRFGARCPSNSIITVLFGSFDPIMVQPVLFKTGNIDFGEWVYVCNSPEDADIVLGYARQLSDLYDVMITVIVMGDNAGFGAANNVAIRHAASERLFIINPDVYALDAYVPRLRQVLANEKLGDTLWGGLLFYDEHNLMHSGMYFERDPFVYRNSLNRMENDGLGLRNGTLMRVEHYDKGVPFEESRWRRPMPVPAISGAVMAFDKQLFEKIGGFSTRYIYGHYEDADLSLRWADEIGRVAIHPDLRLVHLEGQGSRPRGEQYRGAAIANRYFFTGRYKALFDSNPERLTKAPNAALQKANGSYRASCASSM